MICIRWYEQYLYRAVDNHRKTVDFRLTSKREMVAAKRFFDKAMGTDADPNKVAINESSANKAAMDAINASHDVPILVRQVKYSTILSSRITAPSSG